MVDELTIPLKSGDEYDALTGSRKYFYWKSGVIAKIKRGYRKRVRRVDKQKLKDQTDER